MKNADCNVGVGILLRDVCVTDGSVPILHNVCATVPPASRAAVVGPNGAGKSTLLRAVLNDVSYSGTIHFSVPRGSRVRVGYVPQRLAFDRNLPLTVADFLCLRIQKRPLWMGLGADERARVFHTLERVHCASLAKRFLGVLSGGELQRVLLGAALITSPNLLLLDEPATGVDIQGEELFCELLASISSEMKLTQLMVSHDLATVRHHATHVICLNKRVIAEGKPSEVLSEETVLSLFGVHRTKECENA